MKTPPYLILSLNRFKFDRTLKRKTKILKKTPLTKEIYVLDIGANVDFGEKKPTNSEFNNYFESEAKHVYYELFAIVNHLGNTPDHGHYICYAREIISNNSDENDSLTSNWFLFDDNSVTELTFNNIEERLKSSSYETPYALFFQKAQRIQKDQREDQIITQENIEMELNLNPTEESNLKLQESFVDPVIQNLVSKDNLQFFKEISSPVKSSNSYLKNNSNTKRPPKDDDDHGGMNNFFNSANRFIF